MVAVVVVEVRQRRRGEEEEAEEAEETEEEATNIKSNNPHLAGGKKSMENLIKEKQTDTPSKATPVNGKDSCEGKPSEGTPQWREKGPGKGNPIKGKRMETQPRETSIKEKTRQGTPGERKEIES